MDKFWNRDNPLKQVIDDHLIPLVEISEIRPGLGNLHAKILHNNNDLWQNKIFHRLKSN